MGSDENYSLQHMYRYIRLLEWELIRIQNSESQSEELPIRKRLISTRIDYIRMLFQRHGDKFFPNPLLENGGGWTFADLLVHSSFKVPLRPFQKNSQDLFNPVKPREIGRYLCLSVGFAVCCMDLKQSREEPECSSSEYLGPPLPIISTLSMLEEGFPISMGLFKLGSRAYMIGGKELPGLAKQPQCLWDPDIYELVYSKYGVKGSSRGTYYLSLADDHHHLSLYECDIIPPLNKPKIWPIVEKIGNHIHVIDSIPNHLYYTWHYGQTGPFSHEVLDLDDLRPGWTELSHPAEASVLDTHISEHIVVGNRIYAKFYSGDCLVFDCKTNKWELVVESYACPDPFSIKHVAQIFHFGFGRSAAGVLCEELKDMYDVVIAVGSVLYSMEMVAVAYLINKTGQVVCYKPLPNFFDKVKQPFFGTRGKVITVDEEGKTFCVIFEGVTKGTLKNFIFISTFSFGVADVDPDLRSSDGDLAESNFIELKVKDCYVYDKEAVIKEHGGDVEVSGAFFF